jgi:DNA-directed RNA polymerase specialized sigma24 family protein
MKTKAVRPTLAALLSAASLSIAAPVAAEQQTASQSADAFDRDSASEREAVEHDGAGESLRALIDSRLEQAAEQGRHEEIEQLSTLWMTLATRDQLDRKVERGEGFLNVALRNQRYSRLRSEARHRRVALVDRAVLEEISPSKPQHTDEAIDVERFVSHLPEPYRGAVQLSLEGLNHREIAEEMGVSHAAARKWAQRLRERVTWPE